MSRFPLAGKVAGALLALAVPALLFLLFWFAPRATESFRERSGSLIAASREEMTEMARERVASHRELLVSLIAHTTDARRRRLADMPFSLYEGDPERIRGAIESMDADQSARLRANVEIIAREMERRFLDDVDRRVGALVSEESVLSAAYTSELRRDYLAILGSLFAALIALFGAGLFSSVIAPIRRLRSVTQAVARGDLSQEPQVASRDEIGDLAHDFAGMIRQLRASRAELETLNRGLASEVAAKTAHLERALEDLRQAQRKLVHAEKMASLGTLAGGVAHEYNNLIGGIRGSAAEALEAESDSSKREPLEVILRAADRAKGITDRLLRFARREPVRLRETDVANVLDEALVLALPEARKCRVEVERRIDAHAAFAADGNALHQVFLNLFSNALQAMPGGGTLRVTAGVENRDYVVRVADTGPGIEPGVIDRVFEPFFTTRDGEPGSAGSGLGLSVSYGIVEAHGGTLAVESEVGKGATFIVRIPIRKAPPSERNDATP
jgi:two-component system NtrC family sensor kinase